MIDSIDHLIGKGAGMDVVQLERFLRIATAGSFRAAARGLGLSQAALSFSIQQLEHELGGALFERSGSGARLSALGTALRGRAELIVAQSARMKEDAVAQLGRGAPRLNVGTTEPLATVVMPRAAAALLEEMPDLDLRMAYADSDTMLNRLRTGEFDVVLCSPKAGSDLSGLEFEPTYEERFVLAARAAHPLFRDGAAPAPERVRAYGWIMHEGASPVGTLGALEGRLADFQAHVRVRVPAHSLTRSMLLTTDLLGYVVEDLIRDDLRRGTIRVLEVEGVNFRTRAGLLVRRGAPSTPAAKRLCRALRLASRELMRARGAAR